MGHFKPDCPKLVKPVDNKVKRAEGINKKNARAFQLTTQEADLIPDVKAGTSEEPNSNTQQLYNKEKEYRRKSERKENRKKSGTLEEPSSNTQEHYNDKEKEYRRKSERKENRKKNGNGGKKQKRCKEEYEEWGEEEED
ncbi:protein PXR1-like [Helianthus annuus]|uniref:protein PXR1-like n=1 Tax=Helianthus annuus TaxID=4232 RepID=UPI000B8FC726|nr:protein PXR1-like [Helianthus annuus]